MMRLTPSTERHPARWPRTLPSPPTDLVELISNAMIDFSSHGTCDGAEKIAAIVAAWYERTPVPLREPLYLQSDERFSSDDVRRIGNIASDDWTRGDVISHWRFHVDERTRRLWHLFSDDQKIAIAKACHLEAQSVLADITPSR